MKRTVALIAVMLSGCSQFSTQLPEYPRKTTITNEHFEKDYIVRTKGAPTFVSKDYNDFERQIEYWFYPEQKVVVVVIIEGEHYFVKTYTYKEVVE